MSLTVGFDGEFALPDEGVHLGVCVDVYEKTLPNNFKPGETVRKVKLVFELDKPHPSLEGNFRVNAFMTASLHPKSKLRPFLEHWRGRKFTDEEAKSFNLEALIGAPAQIQVIHNDGYANVASIMPLVNGQVPFRGTGTYVRVKDRPDEFGRSAPGAGAPVQQAAPAQPAPTLQQADAFAQPAGTPADFAKDDLPF